MLHPIPPFLPILTFPLALGSFNLSFRPTRCLYHVFIIWDDVHKPGKSALGFLIPCHYVDPHTPSLRSSSPSGLFSIIHHKHACLTDNLVPIALLHILFPSHSPFTPSFRFFMPQSSQGAYVSIPSHVYTILHYIHIVYLAAF